MIAPREVSSTATRTVHSAHAASASAPRPRTVLWRRVLVGAAIVAAIVYRGARREPMGPATGVAFDAPAVAQASDRETLRVGTFNIHGCKGVDGVLDVRRIAETLRGCDFVGLNEARYSEIFDARSQTALLGEQLQMAWLDAPTEERWWHDQFGNGALSKLAIASWQRIPLPRSFGKSFRNVVLIRAEHAGRPLNIVVTHIDRSDDRERAEQLRAVGDLFLSLAEPAILMGDMNTDATEPALRRLLDAPGVHDPLHDQLGDASPRKIDWILTRGLETIDAGLVLNGASDHPHVWAELAWPVAERDVAAR